MRQEGYQSITRLRLSSYQLSGEGARSLGLANFPKALLMILYSNNLTSDDMRNLVPARWPLLSQLDLSQNNISDEGVRYLVQMNLPNLQSVNLRENKITDKGAEHFRQANWPILAELMLSKNQIQAEGIKSLAAMNSPHIFILVLTHNKIEDIGLDFLSQSEMKIQRLYLDNCGFSFGGYQYFGGSNWTKLRHLSLTNNKISSTSLRLLLRNEWVELEQISLNSTPQLNNAGIYQSGGLILSKCHWPNLKIINLNCMRPGKSFLEKLCTADWAGLKRIFLYGNEIQSAQLSNLCLTNWSQVVEVNLGGNLLGKTADILKSVISKWTQLSTLYLKNSNIPEQLQQKIEENLQN